MKTDVLLSIADEVVKVQLKEKTKEELIDFALNILHRAGKAEAKLAAIKKTLNADFD